MTPQDRKLTQGTVIPSFDAGAKFYIVPSSGTIPWGYQAGSVIAGVMYFGGAVYPIASIPDGYGLYRNGGTIDGFSPITAAGTVVFTNKVITPRVFAEASNGTISLNVDLYDQHNVTALAVAGTVPTPTGTPFDAQKIILRIKDNGTARALTWSGIFRAVGNSLPTTTVLSKIIYLGFVYNSTETKWDLIAKAQEA